MSQTWSLVCDETREKIWIGQGTARMSIFYTAHPEIMAELKEFLADHRDKPLRFICDEGNDECLEYKDRTSGNTSVKTYFLVIDDHDNADPQYHLRSTKKAALELARRLADDAIDEYGDMEHYPNEHTGEDGWWFHESGEQCWNVTVREVEAD